MPPYTACSLMMPRLQRWIESIWYGARPAPIVLRWLAWLFGRLAVRRRQRLQASAERLSVPVIIIGNISVGGTGKTPLIAALVEQLRDRGLRPGLISRGYGGRARHWPQPVQADSDPAQLGDEPVMLAQRLNCPIWVGPDRVAAARALLANSPVDVLLSDDGLQHYRLGRDMELAVVDGVRGLGNGQLLPAGPLREPAERLAEVDLVVCNTALIETAARSEICMHLLLQDAVNLLSGERRPLAEFRADTVHAVAGIGHPERFFGRLESAGLSLQRHAFADHHAFTAADLAFVDELPVLMTDKDAVKCRPFADERCWRVPVDAVFDAQDSKLIHLLIDDCLQGHPAWTRSS